MRQREDKVEQQKIHQEERIRRALERAKAEPKKRVRLTPTAESHTHSLSVFNESLISV